MRIYSVVCVEYARCDYGDRGASVEVAGSRGRTAARFQPRLGARTMNFETLVRERSQ